MNNTKSLLLFLTQEFPFVEFIPVNGVATQWLLARQVKDFDRATSPQVRIDLNGLMAVDAAYASVPELVDMVERLKFLKFEVSHCGAWK